MVEEARMTTNNQFDDVGHFLSVIEQGAELWHTIEARVLAVKSNGEWHNLLTSIFLHSGLEREPRLTKLPRLDNIACWQSILPIESVGELVLSISKGRLRLQDECIHYLRGLYEPNKEPSPYGRWSYFFSLISDSRQGSSLPWSTHRLTSTGDAINSHLQQLPKKRFEIDSALRALEHPVDGLDGLASLVLKEPNILVFDHSSLVTILAPIEARLRAAECRLESGRLHFKIEANSKAVLDCCSLGYVSGPASPDLLTGTITITGIGCEVMGGVYVFTGYHDLPHANDLTLFLRVAGFSVQRVKVLDYETITENPRVASYNLFDPGLDLFKQWLLTDDHPNASQFELATARLLTFLGFQVDILSGDARLGDAVDILAFGHPHQIILAVECTTRSIGAGGKLGKLVDRAKHLEVSLETQDVIPVIVTAISRSRLSKAEINEAARDGIAVLARESLQLLLESLVEGSSLSSTIALIRSNVPKANWPNRQ